MFAYQPGRAGAFRVWISWGQGWATHSQNATYVLDRDGDPTTLSDQAIIAVVDQQREAMVSEKPGALPGKPLWSGFRDVGVHEFSESSVILLRGGSHGVAITADAILLQVPDSNSRTAPLRAPVQATGNVERFDPLRVHALRLVIETTNNGDNPCIDELSVWSGGTNIAPQALATSSGDYPNNPKHQLAHINDGRFGNSYSWISNEAGKGWVALHWDAPKIIDRITWGRDRDGAYKDRVPHHYRIEVQTAAGASWTRLVDHRSRISVDEDEAGFDLAHLSGDEAKAAQALLDRVKALQEQREVLTRPAMVYAGKFVQPKAPTHLLYRGDPLAPREVVAPDGIETLNHLLGQLELAADAPEQARRVALAKWITHPKNPLTTRVMVNRLWHYHFGRGIVASPSDFGDMGYRPTHPELLDWLASELLAQGGSLKHIHRLILSSKTYAQSAAPRSDALGIDAGAQFLWRFPPRRLEAEAIRDNLLLVAGNLDRRMYGPAFMLFQPNANYARNWVPKQEFGKAEYRRMVYALKLRMEQDAVFGAFDCPDAGSIAPARSRSTTPIQALNLFNSPFVLSQAEAFAARCGGGESGVDAQVERVYHLAYGRVPNAEERAAAIALVEQHGLVAVCRAVFNSNEFLFMP